MILYVVGSKGAEIFGSEIQRSAIKHGEFYDLTSEVGLIDFHAEILRNAVFFWSYLRLGDMSRDFINSDLKMRVLVSEAITKHDTFLGSELFSFVYRNKCI